VPFDIRAGSRLVAAIGVAASALLLGAGDRATAHSALSLDPIKYVTEYSGSYYFNYYERGFASAAGSLSTVSEEITWDRVVDETISPHADGSLTDSYTTKLSAHGVITGAFTNGSAGLTKYKCELTSPGGQGITAKSVLHDAYNGAIPASANPWVPIGWSIPTVGPFGNAPTGDDKLRVSGDPRYCPSMEHFVLLSADENGAPHVHLALTRELNDAVNGGQEVRLNDLPFHRSFAADISGTGGNAAGNTTAAARVQVFSTVYFDRIYDAKPIPTPEVNKIGALLLAEGFAAVTSGRSTPLSGSAPVITPTEETIVLPGAPELGKVSLDVNGVVSTPTHLWRLSGRADRRTLRRAAPTTLETGSGRGNSAGDAFAFTITPSAAGRGFFSAPHPELRVSATLTLVFAGKTFSETQTLVAPALAAVETPSITSVLVQGDTQNPSFVVRGVQLGAKPAPFPNTPPANCGAVPGDAGYDYATNLGLHDNTTQLGAGWDDPATEFDCIGLVVTRFTPTEVDFHLGAAYKQFFLSKSPVRNGDSITVDVNGTQRTVHVKFGTTTTS
jgi:hypothetical protein